MEGEGGEDEVADAGYEGEADDDGVEVLGEDLMPLHTKLQALKNRQVFHVHRVFAGFGLFFPPSVFAFSTR